MINRIRIAIEPRLIQQHGPEVHWTWRLLLTGIGWSWEETSIDSICDVAYVTEPSRAPGARLCILAKPQAWARPTALRLASIGHQDGLTFPLFDSEAAMANLGQIHDGQMVCHRDLIFDVYWLATGQEEQLWPRDKHGFLDLSHTGTLEQEVPRQALASQIGIWLRDRLLDLGCPSPMPRWPNGKQAVASASHDVDYPEVNRWLEPLRIALRLGTAGIGPALDVLTGRRSHWHFSDWIELEKDLQTRSAFYFAARQGSLLEYALGTPDPFYDICSPQFRQLFQCLAAEGFEVGLHTSYLAYQSHERLVAEKRRLEEASNQPVIGNRHHYWHLNPDNVEETLLLHEQVGFKYDTSLIHNHYVGWRRGLSHPFFPFHQAQRRELRTLQIPTAWMDDHLFGLQDYNPGDRWEILQALADRTVEQEGCLLVDIHDYVFDDTLFPGWVRIYRRLWENLLDRGGFWFATPAAIAEHWSARYKVLIEASQGLEEGLP